MEAYGPIMMSIVDSRETTEFAKANRVRSVFLETWLWSKSQIGYIESKFRFNFC